MCYGKLILKPKIKLGIVFFSEKSVCKIKLDFRGVYLRQNWEVRRNQASFIQFSIPKEGLVSGKINRKTSKKIWRRRALWNWKVCFGITSIISSAPHELTLFELTSWKHPMLLLLFSFFKRFIKWYIICSRLHPLYTLWAYFINV